MAREICCLDVTTFGRSGTAGRARFLDWITRHERAEAPPTGPGTAATVLQSGRSDRGIRLAGAWSEAGTGRALSLYACRGGWDGGWRDMLGLCAGVPDSLFLSPIDGARETATTVPLLAAPTSPPVDELRGGALAGRWAGLQWITTRPGAELDLLAEVAADQDGSNWRLAGAWVVGYADREVVVLRTADEPAPLPAPPRAARVGAMAESLLRAHPGPALSGVSEESAPAAHRTRRPVGT